MYSYLRNKYSYLNEVGKVCNHVHVEAELLCSANMARMHIKEVLGKTYENFSKEDFIKIVIISLDLDG